MVCRRLAALLLGIVLAGIGTGVACAATSTLSSTPPSTLGGPPPGLTTHHHHHHRHPAPVKTTTSSAAAPGTRTSTTASLPMTGADLPLELGVAGGFFAAGMLALFLARNRRYRYRRF